MSNTYQVPSLCTHTHAVLLQQRHLSSLLIPPPPTAITYIFIYIRACFCAVILIRTHCLPNRSAIGLLDPPPPPSFLHFFFLAACCALSDPTPPPSFHYLLFSCHKSLAAPPRETLFSWKTLRDVTADVSPFEGLFAPLFTPLPFFLPLRAGGGGGGAVETTMVGRANSW